MTTNEFQHKLVRGTLPVAVLVLTFEVVHEFLSDRMVSHLPFNSGDMAQQLPHAQMEVSWGYPHTIIHFRLFGIFHCKPSSYGGTQLWDPYAPAGHRETSSMSAALLLYSLPKLSISRHGTCVSLLRKTAELFNPIDYLVLSPQFCMSPEVFEIVEFGWFPYRYYPGHWRVLIQRTTSKSSHPSPEIYKGSCAETVCLE